MICYRSIPAESPDLSRAFEEISDSNFEYYLGLGNSFLSYTNEEIEFIDINEEQPNGSNSPENICHTFKELISDSFSDYLILKKKILYIQKFMPSDFNELKRNIKLREKSFSLQQEIQWADSFLNFIYTEIIHPSQRKNLNLEQYNPTNAADRNPLLSELQKLDPCALFLSDLLACCPTALFFRK